MITAIVMVTAATDSIPEVAQAIADLEGISEVYSVAGNVDLIAVVRVRRTSSDPGRASGCQARPATEAAHAAQRSFACADLG